MQPKTQLITFDNLSTLNRSWKAGQLPHEDSCDLKAALHAHLEAERAALRRKAAFAAVVTLLILTGEDEEVPADFAARLGEIAVSWATTWSGSAPLAVRVGPITARHFQGRGSRGRTTPAGLAIEVVVAPVRVHHHRGGSSLKVSVNKSLSELTQATLGDGSPTRHSEAVEASWRSYLSTALPDLSFAERAPTARELLLEVRALKEILANVEVLRERNEALEAAQANHDTEVAQFQAFPEQAKAALGLIETKVIRLNGLGALVRIGSADVPPNVSAHVQRHREVYQAILQNPAFEEGVRLALSMVLGELDLIWGVAANRDVEPGDDVADVAEASNTTDKVVDAKGDGASDIARSGS